MKNKILRYRELSRKYNNLFHLKESCVDLKDYCNMKMIFVSNEMAKLRRLILLEKND